MNFSPEAYASVLDACRDALLKTGATEFSVSFVMHDGKMLTITYGDAPAPVGGDSDPEEDDE